MSFALLLVVGLLLAAVGGDRFVHGSVGLASWLRVPAGIIGATVAAFATSSPELTVGVLSAVDGRPDLAFGDATGSNMVNLGVVLGSTLVLAALSVRRAEVRRDLLAFAVAVLLLGAMSLDGCIATAEGLLLLSMFVLWLGWVLRDARRQRSDIVILGDVNHRAIIIDVVMGLVLLIAAGRLIVLGGKGIGEALGWSQFVVGTVIVAIGTTAPELVTTIIAARRGHIGVGVGAVLGSNVFNSLFIVGIAGTITPIVVDRTPALLALAASALAVLLLIPTRRGRLGRGRGVALLATYGAFIAALGLTGQV